MSATFQETAAVIAPAAPSNAPAGTPAPFHPGDVAMLVVRASWDGEATVGWPSREEVERAFEGKLAVLGDAAPAPADVASLSAAAGASQDARAWRVQLLVPPGEHELAALPLRLVDPAGEALDKSEAPGPVVRVATVLDEATDSQLQAVQQAPEQLKAEASRHLAAARGPWELSPVIPWWIWLLLALAAVSLLAWIVKRLLARRAAPPAPAPLEPAEVVARRRLRELRDSDMLVTGRHLEFHVALADILKEYLERRVGADLRELTTDEIRRLMRGRLRAARHVSEARDETLAVLAACDLVKFAKVIPVPSEALAQVDAAERVVARTTVAAPAAPTGPSTEAA